MDVLMAHTDRATLICDFESRALPVSAPTDTHELLPPAASVPDRSSAGKSRSSNAGQYE